MENNEILCDENTKDMGAEEELDALPDDASGDIIDSDLDELRQEFSELAEIKDITELNNPTRYAALRDLGLSPAEAYLATTPHRVHDNRSHLRGTPTSSAGRPASAMTQREWQQLRAIFEDMSDGEIEKLYRKVNK